MTTSLPTFVGIVLGIAAIGTCYDYWRTGPYYLDWREPSWFRPIPQIPSSLLQFLPAALAVRLHAARRFGRWYYGSYTIHSPPYCLHFHRDLRCCWVFYRRNTNWLVFDKRGRILRTNNLPIRFALQRMCRRLVMRTRCRIQCRLDLDRYLVPDLVNITASYI